MQHLHLTTIEENDAQLALLSYYYFILLYTKEMHPVAGL